MKYSSELRRKLLNDRQRLSILIQEKWENVLHKTLQPKWSDVWLQAHAKKELGFIWALWYKALAVNEWCTNVSWEFDLTCMVCKLELPWTILHPFWEYPCAQEAWVWALGIASSFLLTMLCSTRHLTWSIANCQRGCLNSIWFGHCSMVLTLWYTWKERNDLVFNGKRWSKL